MQGAITAVKMSGYVENVDRITAVQNVLADLERAEKRAQREGWVDDEQIQEIMGIDD